jgi:hypothetical protein
MLTVIDLPDLGLALEIFGKIALFSFLREMVHHAEKESNIPESKC